MTLFVIFKPFRYRQNYSTPNNDGKSYRQGGCENINQKFQDLLDIGANKRNIERQMRDNILELDINIGSHTITGIRDREPSDI